MSRPTHDPTFQPMTLEDIKSLHPPCRTCKYREGESMSYCTNGVALSGMPLVDGTLIENPDTDYCHKYMPKEKT